MGRPSIQTPAVFFIFGIQQPYCTCSQRAILVFTCVVLFCKRLFQSEQSRFCSAKPVAATNASFLAELSVSSPRKIFIFIIKKYIFWIKVSKNILFNFEKGSTGCDSGTTKLGIISKLSLVSEQSERMMESIETTCTNA